MKKNTIMRIAAVVLMCTLVTACFASSTFAKYTAGTDAEATARVAKWSIMMGDKDIVVDGDDDIVTFDLFKTAYAGDTVDGNTVVSSGTDNIIAPGTAGSFKFDDVVNKSEVTANIAVVGTVKNDDSIPIQWKLNDGEWSKDFPTIEAANVDAGQKFDGATIYWQWVFEDEGKTADNDATDTAFGANAAAGSASVITVELAITATQVD